jgi:glycine/D-amino acid oxidase-like deaminating enzyme
MSTSQLFDDNMYRYQEPQSSYWEATAGDLGVEAQPLEGDASCEVAIIGGGYTGLSAGYHLARDHNVDTRVLEAGHIGWGASGRNGGFCSMGGSMLELDSLLSRFGTDNVRHYYQVQGEAVELVRQLITDENIDTPMQGDRELEIAHSARAFSEACETAEKQSKLLGIDTETYSADEFRERFCDSAEQFGAASVKPTFGLHPLRYAKGLARAAAGRGAVIHPHTAVREWSNSDGWHRLATDAGTLRARKVVLATNGFLQEDLHQQFSGRILPIISAIVVTRPLSADELAAHRWTTECPAFNTRPLMNYFRLLPDKRFMFGGRGHSTGDVAGSERNFTQLIERLRLQWPEWRKADIDYRWHGFICATRRLTPCVGRLQDDPSVFFGFGYHGNGVNNSNWTGKQIADWIGSGDKNFPDSLPVIMQGLSNRFPLAGLRLRYLQAALTWKRFRDWTS